MQVNPDLKLLNIGGNINWFSNYKILFTNSLIYNYSLKYNIILWFTTIKYSIVLNN